MDEFVKWRQKSKGPCTVEELYAWFGRVPKTPSTGKRKRNDFECDVKGCDFSIETISNQKQRICAMMHSCDRMQHVLQLLYDDSYGNPNFRQIVRNFVFSGYKSQSMKKYFDGLVYSISLSSNPIASDNDESYSSSDDDESYSSSDEESELDFSIESDEPPTKRSKPLFASYLPLDATVQTLFPQLQSDDEI